MCFVVQIRPISYCASLRGHIVLLSNVGLEEPGQIWGNSTLGWGLMEVAYVKSTSSACANSCVVSWVRGFWTAARQLKSLKRADELQRCSSPVKQSPRTNTEGSWSHSCIRKGARTPLIFFFNLPLPCHLNSLHYLEHPSSGALWQIRNRSYDSRRSVLPPFFFFFLPYSFSPSLLRDILSLFSFEMTRSVLCPAATCHQRGSQPRPTTRLTPADVPEWTLGREGARGSGGRTGSERKSP